MKPIILICCTRHTPSDFTTQAPLWPYLQAQMKFGNINKYVIAYENTRSLSEVYNEFLTPEYRDWIALFVHDDIEIYNIDLAHKLRSACSVFDIVGLAGNVFHDPTQSPVRWGMPAPGGAATRSGQVAHERPFTFPGQSSTEKHILTSMDTWGPSWLRVSVIDGLFIAVNVERCLQHQHKFDDRFDFHFYDLDFSYAACRIGLRVGTCDIYVKHHSHGNYDSDSWKAAERKYIDKWSPAPGYPEQTVAPPQY